MEPMNQLVLPQKAFSLASDFVDSPDQFAELETVINRAAGKIKVVWGEKVLNSIFGQFYILWSQPLK
jgi:hypothetical protein